MSLNSEFFANFCGDSVLIDKEIHRVGSDESLGHIPGALIITALAP